MLLKTNLKKVAVYWLPVAIWMLVIYAFSSLPTKPVSVVYWREFIIKKSAHFIEYFTLSVLWYRALLNSTGNKSKSVFFSLLVCVLYAISDEWHQSFTPGREPRMRDIFIDIFGAFSAQFVILKLVPVMSEPFRNMAKRLSIL